MARQRCVGKSDGENRPNQKSQETVIKPARISVRVFFMPRFKRRLITIQQLETELHGIKDAKTTVGKLVGA
jgi:hypothetical protein